MAGGVEAGAGSKVSTETRRRRCIFTYKGSAELLPASLLIGGVSLSVESSGAECTTIDSRAECTTSVSRTVL
jgi:hypothetical protein